MYSFLSIKNEFLYNLIITMIHIGYYTIKDNIISYPDSNMQLLSEIRNIPHRHILIVYEKYIDIIFLHESCNVTFGTSTISFSNCKSAGVRLPDDYGYGYDYDYAYDIIIKMWKDIELLESLFEIDIQKDYSIVVGKISIVINYISGKFMLNNPVDVWLPGFILNIDELIDYIRLNFPEVVKPLMIKGII
jgi:hypothetical protein